MTTMMKSRVGRFPSCRCIHKWLLVMATLRYLSGTYCRGLYSACLRTGERLLCGGFRFPTSRWDDCIPRARTLATLSPSNTILLVLSAL